MPTIDDGLKSILVDLVEQLGKPLAPRLMHLGIAVASLLVPSSIDQHGQRRQGEQRFAIDFGPANLGDPEALRFLQPEVPFPEPAQDIPTELAQRILGRPSEELPVFDAECIELFIR